MTIERTAAARHPTARGILVLLMAALGLMALRAAPAAQAAAPAWRISAISLPTHLRPGASVSEDPNEAFPQYSILVTNVGNAPTGLPITVTDTLPAGLTPENPSGESTTTVFPSSIDCETAGQTVTCTTAGSLGPGRWLRIEIPVDVDPLPEGTTLTNEATVSGGGVATPATATTTTTIETAPAAFDFLDGANGMSTLLGPADGVPVGKAGSRPDQLTADLGFAIVRPGSLLTGADGGLRDLTVDLPRGLVVNPQATAERCTEAQLESKSCPDESQVGTVSALTFTTTVQQTQTELYNMIAPAGTPGEFGFNAVGAGIFVHVIGGVRSDEDYGLSGSSHDILALGTNPVLGAMAQFWGDPTGASHDSLRGTCRITVGSCPVEHRTTPLVTMPSACSGPLAARAKADSWGSPTATREAQSSLVDPTGGPVGVSGCSALEFKPTLTLRPEVRTAETPTGFHVNLHVPQNERRDETATANLMETTVTLPAGLALNPAAAGGLDACSEAQVGLLGTGFAPPHRIRFSAAPANCPEASKVGTVEVGTPLLDHPLPGAVYVARPHENPFGTLLGVYIVVDDPQSGVVAKLPGRVEADPVTGQLTTTFQENPELPFEDFDVDFFGGPRAALRTPATCGSFATESSLAPWSGTPAVHRSDPFQIDQGPNGAPCALDEAAMPNAPGFEAGTLTPIAGSYSPFVMRLQRPDGAQQLDRLSLTLPRGLTGKLAGIPPCPDAALAAAASRPGVAEQSAPSCPAASEVGQVTVGAGAGPQPYYAQGRVYVAGPYRGAPLSLAVVTPAVAGPFDLGTVVVRAAAFVDPTTAQVTATSDPLPHILEGIPLEIRDIRLDMSRPEFTLNPTSCSPKAIVGAATSLLSQVAPLSERFQAGGCRGLDFAPRLNLRLFGKTRRGAHPRLRALVRMKPGEANIASAAVALPHSEFLDQAHIRTVCTRVQFAADACPSGSIYGHATAITPLLDEPLTGPVYLRSSSHELPDVVVALKGPASRPIEVNLAGRVDSIHGGLRNTFEAVPDAPVSKFILNLQGGKRGLIINSRNLCTSRNRATVKLDAQNGKVHDFRPALKTDCGKAAKRKRHHRG